MHGSAQLQPVTEQPPEDMDALRQQNAELIAAAGKSVEHARAAGFAAGFAAGRASVSGREAPRRRHRSTGRHQPFILRLVK